MTDARRPRPSPRPAEPEPADDLKPAARGRARRLLTAGFALVSVLLIAAGVVVFVLARRHDDRAPAATPTPSGTPATVVDVRARLTDPDSAQAYVSAAVTEVVAVTESDYRRLDATLSAGLSVTTDPFRSKFEQALTGTGAAQRRAAHQVTSLDVLAAGIGRTSANGNQADVLVFGRLRQSGADIAAADRSVVIGLRLTLVRRGHQYLISDLVQGANAGLPPGTTGLQSAAEAAREGVLSMLSKHQLRGSVTAIAAQQVSDAGAVFLIAAGDGYYTVTVQRAGTGWRASSITAVGGS